VIVKHLAIEGLRNISRIELDAHPQLNWLTGANGAGKTSILEALHLLARGRSFRGRKYGPLIGTRQDRLEVSACLLYPGSIDTPSPCSSLHYTLTPYQTRLNENGQVVGRAQDLRYPLHVRVIADNAQRLFEGQPEIRRLFLDWNLFHVEPAYGRFLNEFLKVQAQRNAWLKAGGRGPRVWDSKYCQLAEEITRARYRILAGLEEALIILGKRVGYPDALALRLLPGWDTSQALPEILVRFFQEDLHRGYTLYGPARADFVIQLGDNHRIPSRGQTKVLVSLLQMAAQCYAVEQGKPSSIWLVDDLAAELDVIAQERVLAALCELSGQIFVTSLAPPHFPLGGQVQGLMFHVEQGRIERQEALGKKVSEQEPA